MKKSAAVSVISVLAVVVIAFAALHFTDNADKTRQISDLTTHAADQKEQIETLSADVTEKDAQIETLNADAAEKTAQIEALNADAAEKAAQIETLNADVTEKAAQIETLNTKAAEKDASIRQLSAKVSKQAADLQTLNADAAEKAAQIEALNANAAEKDAQIETLSADVAEKAAQIEVLHTDAAGKAAQIEALNTNAADKAALIESLNTNVADKETQISALNKDAAEKAAQIEALNADVADKEGQIDALLADAAEKSAQIGALSADLQNQAAQIGQLTAEKGEYIGRFGLVQTETAKLNFRSTPEMTGEVIGILEDDALIRIEASLYSDGNEWYMIVYDGKTGYVRAEYAAILPEDETDETISRFFDRGIRFFYGEGDTGQDHARALQYFKYAAQLGSGVASYNLGVMYFNGYGTAQDYAKALAYFEEAGKRGYESAADFISLVQERMAETENAVAEKAELETRAADLTEKLAAAEASAKAADEAAAKAQAELQAQVKDLTAKLTAAEDSAKGLFDQDALDKAVAAATEGLFDQEALDKAVAAAKAEMQTVIDNLTAQLTAAEEAAKAAAKAEEATKNPGGTAESLKDVMLPGGDPIELPVMSYAEYAAAELDTEVCIETCVQATQSWWDGKITVYAQSEDGAYFIYNMACSEEDAAKLTPGTRIVVKGFKSEWGGEAEITDATFGFMDGEPFVAEAEDVTDKIGTDGLADSMNRLVVFKGMTVEAQDDGAAFNYKNAEGKTDDLYFRTSRDGETVSFCVEFYLCGQDTDVYKAVERLQVGDVIDVTGFLYWYNGANPHVVAVTPAEE